MNKIFELMALRTRKFLIFYTTFYSNWKYSAIKFTAITQFLDKRVIGNPLIDKVPRAILYPLIKLMIPKWNEATWNEDLPLKLRRQKVKRMNFKDFKGLPKKIKDRKFSGKIDFKLPITRLSKDKDLIEKHPFYNFGRKDQHI